MYLYVFFRFDAFMIFHFLNIAKKIMLKTLSIEIPKIPILSITILKYMYRFWRKMSRNMTFTNVIQFLLKKFPRYEKGTSLSTILLIILRKFENLISKNNFQRSNSSKCVSNMSQMIQIIILDGLHNHLDPCKGL